MASSPVGKRIAGSATTVSSSGRASTKSGSDAVARHDTRLKRSERRSQRHRPPQRIGVAELRRAALLNKVAGEASVVADDHTDVEIDRPIAPPEDPVADLVEHRAAT